SWQSSHDTLSTGNCFSSSSLMSFTTSFPLPFREKELGFLPISSVHCPCVTVYTAISKSSLISVFFAEPFVPFQPRYVVPFVSGTNVIPKGPSLGFGGSAAFTSPPSTTTRHDTLATQRNTRMFRLLFRTGEADDRRHARPRPQGRTSSPFHSAPERTGL